MAWARVALSEPAITDAGFSGEQETNCIALSSQCMRAGAGDPSNIAAPNRHRGGECPCRVVDLS